MSNSYEPVKETSRTNADLVKSLEQRCGGDFGKSNNYLYNLKVHAEDVFVKKKYDELRCEMPGTPRSTFLMVFSPDGSKVASTHGNHNIYVTDVRTGKNIKTLIGHPRTPWCIAFHPTSNQILASGCLGGQVRIWDLSGGSETWTSDIPTVIASIAFHPDDRLLVIATYNELYFWDWSKPEPFLHVATGSIKEKVRYVAFDKLGHKLITGISNSPQTRWERVRAAVPVPRQADRSASPYRRRITPRLISNIPATSYMSENIQTAGATTSTTTATREPLTTVPERERRITACYRNLVREYELLVHRYLQIYRPPAMTDQGTDPMEIELNSITGNNLSGSSSNSHSQSQRSSQTDMGTSLPVLSSTNFNSSGNDINRNVSSVTTEVLSGRSLFNSGSEMDLPQRPSLSSLFMSVNNACDENVYSSPSANLTAFRENLSISSSTSTLQPSRLSDILSDIEGNAVVANSREITTISNQYNERSSLSAAAMDGSSGTRANLNQHSNINLLLPEQISGSSVNRKYQRSEFPFNQATNSTSNIFTDRSNSNNVACDISRSEVSIEDSINRSLISTITSSPVRPVNRITNDVSNACGTTPKSSNDNLNRISHTVLEDLKNVSSNVNIIPDPASATNTQNSRENIIHNENNANNVRNQVNQLTTTTESYLNTTRNSTSNFLDSEPRPSTSGIRSTFLGNCDYLCSGNSVKLFSSRCCEQSRKRDYPLLLKKNRRSVVDSSSDNSSSEEEELASKRLCTAKMTAKLPNIDANDNRVSSRLSEQTTGDKKGPLRNTSLNFNRQLEVLVTDLLVHGESSQNHLPAVPTSQSIAKTNSAPGAFQVCSENSSIASINDGQYSTTTASLANTCSRNTENTETKTTNSATYTNSGGQRPNRSNRFFSHRVSAFYPTRIQHLRPLSRLRRNGNYLSPAVRNRLRILNTLQNPSRLAGTFALDEVINYSERVGTEDVPESDVGFHPFDPPPEFAAINPENIGIGNMYSNIVQELESSLNDVRNIRASNRLGETSDMLSSFSERLESIMNQSNSILRNLRTSIDTLQPSPQSVTISSNNTDRDETARTNQPRISFRDSNFYLREQAGNQTNEETTVTSNSTNTLERSTSQEEIYSTASNPVASDHTYPLNSRNSESATNNMSPLMASLHLTVSHIQRQARLLRQQVESIERIDRAMLEVAQLQMMRQMFIEMQCYFRATPCHENRNSLSRVRQMMAGTRISDSTPYDSPNDDSNNESQNDATEERLHRNGSNSNVPQNSTVVRNPTRKAYPRCIFLMQRCFRRGSAGNIFQRRCLSRDRITRRHSFRRSFAFRSSTSRTPAEFSRHLGSINQLSSDTLRSITRRLENFLMEHGRHIGRVLDHSRSSASTEKDEYIMMLRLNQCRSRILGQESYGNSNIRRQTNSVTSDGSTRYNARDMLTAAIENLSGHIINGTNITQSLRTSIWNVIALSLLLSEILLLQIVDSIPPPSGMNLDPERESLSARIDQMCSRMLQNRLSGQSQQLTRSLRLTRLAVRHASRALNQTYTARRNTMLSNDRNRDQRRMLLEEINNCLRNIRRHGFVTQISNQRTGTNVENLSRTEWYRTIHSLITRYRHSSVLDNSQSNTNISNTNTDNSAQTETLRVMETTGSNAQGSSDDDNETYWYNNSQSSNATSDERSDHTRPLYRTNNVNLFNLLNTDEQNPSATSRNHSWNIPTVQINDVPISQYQSQWHPRLLTSRQRAPERFLELRTYPIESIYRHRLLRPPHTNNPFEADFDESVREQLYDSDIMTPITPNHRIQVWEFSTGVVPNINNALKNVVVNECKIHNDASVDIANNGSILVTLLPSGGYLNGTNRLGVYSLKWETLGQCLYITNFEQNAVSVSLSPLSRHLVVGLASRRVSATPSEKWTMARIFLLDDISATPNQLLSIREVEQTRDPNYMSVNCIRWLPVSGQGLVYATNTGQLRILT